MRVKDWQKLEFIQNALKEDIGRGDLFSKVIESKKIEAYILAKSDGIFAGREYIEAFESIFDIELNKLSYGVKHEELDFVDFSEETLGNALGISAGLSICSKEPIYCNISDGALQMGPTLEAIQFIGINKLNILLSIDFNSMTLTSSLKGIDSFNIQNMFEMYGWNTKLIDTRVLNDKGMKLVIQEEMNRFFDNKKPTALIFKTNKGQGVIEMENDPILWHYKELKNINDITIKD